MAKALKLPQLSKEQIQILAGAVICCAAFGFVYWNYFWSPTSERIKTANEKLEQLETDITAAEIQERRLPKLKAEVKQLEIQKEEAKRRLPKDKNISGLIKILTDLGRKYNIEIHSISPRGVKQETYYAKVSYGLSLTGTYHSIGRFITALGTLERIFSTENLAISGSADGSARATLTLIAYQYKG